MKQDGTKDFLQGQLLGTLQALQEQGDITLKRNLLSSTWLGEDVYRIRLRDNPVAVSRQMRQELEEDMRHFPAGSPPRMMASLALYLADAVGEGKAPAGSVAERKHEREERLATLLGDIGGNGLIGHVRRDGDDFVFRTSDPGIMGTMKFLMSPKAQQPTPHHPAPRPR